MKQHWKFTCSLRDICSWKNCWSGVKQQSFTCCMKHHYLFVPLNPCLHTTTESSFDFCDTFQWRFTILTSVILVMHPAWQGEKYVTESDPQIGSKVAVVQSHPTLHVDIMLSILKCEQIGSNVDACNCRHYIWYNTTNTEMWTNKVKGRCM